MSFELRRESDGRSAGGETLLLEMDLPLALLGVLLDLLHKVLEFLALSRACGEGLELSCVGAFLLDLTSLLLLACKSALPGLPGFA